MDEPAIIDEISRRNALRRAHGLPLLDVETELGRQVSVARQREYREFCQQHADEYESICQQVQGEHGPRIYDTVFGRWAIGRHPRVRFTAYMAERYGIYPPSRTG